MDAKGLIVLILAILLECVGSYSAITSRDDDEALNLNVYGGKIFAVEWILPAANKSSKKKTLAVLTETQIVTIDPTVLTLLHNVSHGFELEEGRSVFRYLPASNALLACSLLSRKNCSLFRLGDKWEFPYAPLPTDFGLYGHNGVLALPLPMQDRKNSSRLFLALKTGEKSFIVERELPKVKSRIKHENDKGLSNVDKMENLYAFNREGFSYFLRNAEIKNQSSGATVEVLKLTRICSSDTSNGLKSWMDISLSCSGATDFRGGAAVYTPGDKKDRLIVGERPDFHRNNVLNNKNRICVFDMVEVNKKFQAVWSECQQLRAEDREDCDSDPKQEFCDSYSHSTKTFCEAYGGRVGSYSDRICMLDDYKGNDYSHIENYRRFDGELFTRLEEGHRIGALADGETGSPFVIFAVVSSTSASYVQRIAKRPGSEKSKVVWQKAAKTPHLAANANLWIATSSNTMWKINVGSGGKSGGCRWLYPDCPSVLHSFEHEPQRCVWCVAKNGTVGYAASLAECPKEFNKLKKYCLPSFEEKIVSSKNDTVLHIQGKGLDVLGNSWAKTAVTTCEKTCAILEITKERIRCQASRPQDASCSARISFWLESEETGNEEFQVTVAGADPTSLPGHMGPRGMGDVAYLAAGVVLAVLVGGVCLGAVLWRKRKTRKPDDDGGSSILPLPVNGAGYLHPRGRIARNSYDGQPGQSIPMDLVPYEDLEFLVPENIRIELNSLDIANVVGEGHFGIVYKAIYKTPEGTDVLVAVKTLHAGVRGVREFLQEGIIMEHFNHPRVMSLMGISFTEANFPMIITPFMPKGDLLSYLRDPSNTPNLRQLLKFAVEIGEGMQYLHKLKFIHRDLAARNCMLDVNLGVKIADFGLCRDVYESGSYEPRHRDRDLPLRWMAPESIERQEYTFKGDVWSYGVVVWELMTRGAVPYHGTPGYLILPFLKGGDRLAQPDYCPPQLYEVMMDCWRLSLSERPSFSQVCLTVPGVIQALETSLGHQKSLEHHYYVNWEAEPVDDIAAV